MYDIYTYISLLTSAFKLEFFLTYIVKTEQQCVSEKSERGKRDALTENQAWNLKWMSAIVLLDLVLWVF